MSIRDFLHHLDAEYTESGSKGKFISERKAHPPLGAGPEVSHGVEVVITGNHVNRTAPSGWMVRLVRLGFLFLWRLVFGSKRH